MRLTILRTPPYAYHNPHVFGSKQRYDWVDQGYQEDGRWNFVPCDMLERASAD
ncbi:MAG: hypothetical protein U0401_35555 [Anaerolineae bacterium]